MKQNTMFDISPVPFKSNFIFHGIWLILHFAHENVLKFLKFKKQILKTLKPKKSLQNYNHELIGLSEKVKTLQKVPNHLAMNIIITEEEISAQQCKVKLFNSIAKTVAYAYAAGLRTISLYDYQGIIKTHQGQLEIAIRRELDRAKLILNCPNDDDKKHESGEETLTNLNVLNGNRNIINDINPKARDVLNLFLFSREDGKPAIIHAIKDIFVKTLKDRKNDDSSAPRLTETVLNEYIDRHTYFGNSPEGIKLEPDVLMVFGDVKSTMDFLPWHLRLSEIHWMPTIHKADLSDFLGSLLKFSGCQQRFGK